MKKRQYKNPVGVLLAQGQHIVRTTTDQVFRHRCTIVNMVLSGTPATKVAESSKEAHSTISRWVRIVDEKGFEALRPKKRSGRPSRLTSEQEANIAVTIEVDDPNDYGYYVWDGVSLSNFIKEKYNTVLGVRQCQRLLHKMNFSLIRPQPFPSKGNEDSIERQEFKKKMAEISADPNAVVVFQDEVHFQITTSVTRTWAPKGSAPKVKTPAGKAKVSYSGFVRPDTGELFVDETNWFNYETFLESVRNFLAVSSCTTEQKIFMFIDNASWHKKAKRLVQEDNLPEYQDIRNRLIFISIPKYSPDLNPIEQCWRKARREVTHNTYFKNKIELACELELYFDEFLAPNAQISSLCSFPWDDPSSDCAA